MNTKIIKIFILLTVATAGCASVALAHPGDELAEPGILPDSPFYFVKRIFESTGTFLTFSPEAKFNRYLLLAEKRLAEAKELLEKNKLELATRSLDAYNTAQQKADDQLQKLMESGKDVMELTRKAEESVAKHIVVLQEVLERAPEAAREGLQRAIEVSSKVIQKMLEPSVTLLGVPAIARVNQELRVTWRVNSLEEKTINHTAVHYDYQSHPGEFDKNIAPPQSGYPNLTPTYAQTASKIPATFSDVIVLPKAGTLYLRAHAIIEGKHYWTSEQMIEVIEAVKQGTAPTPTPAPQPIPSPPKPTSTPTEAPKLMPAVKTFTIEADDNGFYPTGNITVSRGDIVKITFKVRTENVYFGGLDFRGEPYFRTSKVLPGGETSIEFTADKTFVYRSYWPASGIIKSSAQVTIE